MIFPNDSLVTVKMFPYKSYEGPDGSYIWNLPDIRRTGLCKCILLAGNVSSAKKRKKVNEIWYFVSGSGLLWRKKDVDKKEKL